MSKVEKIILSALTAVVMALLAVFLLRPSPAQEQVRGEFTPPEFDAGSVLGSPNVEYPEMYGTLTLSEGISVSMYSAPIVQGETAQVCFTAPANNEVWVRLRIMDDRGNVLGETGLVRPGDYVEYVTLLKKPESSAAVAKILTYEPETYYSMGTAVVEIKLQIK